MPALDDAEYFGIQGSRFNLVCRHSNAVSPFDSAQGDNAGTLRVKFALGQKFDQREFGRVSGAHARFRDARVSAGTSL